MAQKKSKSTEKTKIRRIKATDDAPKKATKKEAKPTKKSVKKAPVDKKPSQLIAKAEEIAKNRPETAGNPLKRLLKYFKDSWVELKLVRWPTRSATWSMTLAVIIFSAIFVALIILLDAGFSILFEKIMR